MSKRKFDCHLGSKETKETSQVDGILSDIKENSEYYKVKEGDTLYSIVIAFYKYNGLTDNKTTNFLKKLNLKNIKPGDKISFKLLEDLQELTINGTVYVLDIANNKVDKIGGGDKEKAEVFNRTTAESLKKLLETITPNEHLKGIYTALDILLKTDNFSLKKTISILSKLNTNWQNLLGPEYKDNPKAKEAIEIYAVIFLQLDSNAKDAIKIISAVFDDEKIPKLIKLKLAQYLTESVLPYMIAKPPGFEDINVSKLDDKLKDIYNKVKKYKLQKSLSVDDANKLVSFQSILESPKYKNNKKAQVLGDIISEIFGTYTYVRDLTKTERILKSLKKNYSYKWDVNISN